MAKTEIGRELIKTIEKFDKLVLAVLASADQARECARLLKRNIAHGGEKEDGGTSKPNPL